MSVEAGLVGGKCSLNFSQKYIDSNVQTIRILQRNGGIINLSSDASIVWQIAYKAMYDMDSTPFDGLSCQP